MAYSAITNDFGLVEIRRIPEGATIEQLNDKPGREFSKGLLVQEADLPNPEYRDGWEIVNGQLVIGQKAIDRLKNECKALIDAKAEKDCCANIVVSGREYQVDADAMTMWIGSTTSLNWRLADNTMHTLTAVEASEIAAQVITRRDTIKNAAFVEKDALPNTIEELETKKAELNA